MVFEVPLDQAQRAIPYEHILAHEISSVEDKEDQEDYGHQDRKAQAKQSKCPTGGISKAVKSDDWNSQNCRHQNVQVTFQEESDEGIATEHLTQPFVSLVD